MTWDYRVLRQYDEKSGQSTYLIHEVYYDDDGNIKCWTKSHVEPSGKSLDELREDVLYFMKACRLPVLIEKSYEGEKDRLVIDNEIPIINTGHYDEILDRVWVATEYINQFLGCHPVIESDNKLHEVYSKAEEALSELYQIIGAIEK